MTSSPNTTLAGKTTSYAITTIVDQMTSSHSSLVNTTIIDVMNSSPNTTLVDQITSSFNTTIVDQMISSFSTITPLEKTSSPGSISSENIASPQRTIASDQLKISPTTIISDQLISPGSSAATESMTSPCQSLSQETPHTESFTSSTYPSSTTLLPGLGSSTGSPQQYSTTFTLGLNESMQVTQTLSTGDTYTLLSSTHSSKFFAVEPSSLASSSSYALLTSSSSIFQTSFLESPSYSYITSTEIGSHPPEVLAQTSMTQFETYLSGDVTKSLTESNSDFSALNITEIFPTATEIDSSVNGTDTSSPYNSTLELPHISQTLIESTTYLESPYGESTSVYYQDINATESTYYENASTDFWNVTEEIPNENTTAVTDIWNTTEAVTTTLNTTLLTTLKTTAKPSTVTTTTKTTTRATTVSSTTEVPMEDYSLTVPVIIGITVSLVVFTALIFVMLLWRRKVKQDQSVNVPKRYSVNSTKSSSFKHSSLYGRPSGEHPHPHFAPVYYGETNQEDEQKSVRMSSYKIKDTKTQVGLTFDEVKLRLNKPVSRVEQLRLEESSTERHSFPYEKRRLHFYSQYGQGPKDFNHPWTPKEINNGHVSKHGVNGMTEVDKPEYIKLNGVPADQSEDSASTKPPMEDTKL